MSKHKKLFESFIDPDFNPDEMEMDEVDKFPDTPMEETIRDSYDTITEVIKDFEDLQDKDKAFTVPLVIVKKLFDLRKRLGARIGKE